MYNQKYTLIYMKMYNQKYTIMYMRVKYHHYIRVYVFLHTYNVICWVYNDNEYYLCGNKT